MEPAAVFDPERLRQDLASMTRWKRVAFAISCVEILIPSYARFAELENAGNPEFVRATTDAVWAELGRASFEIDASDLPSTASVRELLPGEDEWNEWAPQAEDAIASLVYLLELVHSNDISYVVYAAQRAYAAVDEFAARQFGLGVLDAEQRAELLQSASIQTELVRQEDALRVLRESSDGDESVLSNLRATSCLLAVGGEQ
jgi:uncharacterized protein YjaG (DUF416 family)